MHPLAGKSPRCGRGLWPARCLDNSAAPGLIDNRLRRVGRMRRRRPSERAREERRASLRAGCEGGHALRRCRRASSRSPMGWSPSRSSARRSTLAMSVFVFAGSAQFGSVAVLGRGRRRAGRAGRLRPAERALRPDGDRACSVADGPLVEAGRLRRDDDRRLLGDGRPRAAGASTPTSWSAPRSPRIPHVDRRNGDRRLRGRPDPRSRRTSASTPSFPPSSWRCCWAASCSEGGRRRSLSRCSGRPSPSALTPVAPAGVPVIAASSQPCSACAAPPAATDDPEIEGDPVG